MVRADANELLGKGQKTVASNLRKEPSLCSRSRNRMERELVNEELVNEDSDVESKEEESTNETFSDGV